MQPQPQPTTSKQEEKGDTLTIGGKEITKKQAAGLATAAIALTTALGGVIVAIKRVKTINNGKETGIIQNLKDGLNSIFTKEGRKNYQNFKKTINAKKTPVSADSTPITPNTPDSKPAKTSKTKTKGDSKKAGQAKAQKTKGQKTHQPKKNTGTTKIETKASQTKPAPKVTDTQPKPKAPTPQEIAAQRTADAEAAQKKTEAFQHKLDELYGLNNKPLSAKYSAEFMERYEKTQKEVISKATPEIQKALGSDFTSYLADFPVPIGWNTIAKNLETLGNEFTPDEIQKIVKSGDISMQMLKTYLSEQVNTLKDLEDIASYLHKVAK